jgi:hypothetical protein
MPHYGIQIKGTSPIIEKKPRPLSSQSPFLSVYKEGGDVGKRRKFGPKAPPKRSPKPGPHARDPHKPTPKGRQQSPQPKSTEPRKPKPKVEEDWAAEGGRIGFKDGGDSRWIQKATKSIKERGTKGKCTPITKPGCTGRAKALAKTFKKMAKKRKNA